MDKLKYIKLENANGSYSDSIPLAVDGDHVDVDGESVELKLNKKPYYYNSVADMKIDEKLKVGDMAVTLGYYNINDGGAGKYHIRAKMNEDIEDNGSIHFIANNLIAELVVENYVSPEMFGAKGDGITDDTESFQACFNNGKNILCNGGKSYNLCSDIIRVTKGNQILDLNRSSIIDATFAFNMNNALTDWKNAYYARSFTCKNGTIGSTNKIRNGKKDVAFITGGYLKLENLTVCRTPYLVAHAQRFIDHFLMNDIISDNWQETAEDYSKGLDYINVINRSTGDIQRISNTVYSQGDDWIIRKVSEIHTTFDNNYRLMRVAFHNPIKFDMCIQIGFQALWGANIICNGCHFEAVNACPSALVLEWGGSITFNNCGFVSNYEIIDSNRVSYNNCTFNVGFESPTKWNDYFRKPIEQYSCNFNRCYDFQHFIIDSDSIKIKARTNLIKEKFNTYYIDTSNIQFFEALTQGRNGILPNGEYEITTFVHIEDDLTKCAKKFVNTLTKTDIKKPLITAYNQLIGKGYLCIFYITFPDETIKKGWIRIDDSAIFVANNQINSRFIIWDNAVGLYNENPLNERYWNTLVDVSSIPDIEVVDY